MINIQSLLDLLFPPHCAGCDTTGSPLCAPCLTAIRPIPKPYCTHCHSPLTPNSSCRSCTFRPFQLSGLRCASIYQNPLRKCIHAFKYDGVVRLAQPLGTLLAHTYQHTRLSANLVIPVPLHHERKRQRGYNHAALLAKVCAEALNQPFREDLIERSRATRAQASLTPDERARNVAGAFHCPTHTASQIRGQHILLVDDVCTSGSTLEACAAPLFMHGARTIWGLVLARPYFSK